MISMLDKDRLDTLAGEIEKAGRYAFRMQSLVHRSFKSDGSVLTEADTAISRHITGCIHELFPEAGVISEEEKAEDSRDREWIFILDPIDGTDVYSQGLPSFAVSLGILNGNREPVGAYISAPRFGIGTESLFVRLDPGGDVTLNGEKLETAENKNVISQITMGSKGARELDFSSFRGKVRVFGSTIIHILSPVIFPSIEGTVVQKCFVWDIVSAHAVMKRAGMDLEKEDGTPFSYSDSFIFSKEPLDTVLYGGTERGRRELRTTLPPK